MDLRHQCALAMGNIKHAVELITDQHLQEMRSHSAEWDRAHRPDLGFAGSEGGAGGAWHGAMNGFAATVGFGGGGGSAAGWRGEMVVQNFDQGIFMRMAELTKERVRTKEELGGAWPT